MPMLDSLVSHNDKKVDDLHILNIENEAISSPTDTRCMVLESAFVVFYFFI